MKIKNIVISLMLLVVALVTAVSAVAVTPNAINAEINGIPSTSGDIYVETDSTLDIEVDVRGDADGSVVDEKEIRLMARIDGTDDDLEAKTGSFLIQEGVVRSFKLSIDIPEDMPAEDDYLLKIFLLDKDGSDQIFQYDLRVEPPKDRVSVKEVILRDENFINAGSYLFATVRVENQGKYDEKDLRIEVSIPELGVKGVSYIDRLEKNDVASNVGDSSSNDELFLRIPKDAETGEYELVTTVSYDNGRRNAQSKQMIHIEGASAATVSEDLLNLRADSTLKSVEQGKGIAYTVMFANTGSEAKVYTAKVVGADSWASTARVDPTSLTVAAGETGEFVAFVQASESAEAGRKAFTVRVSSGDNVVGEINLAADVAENSMSGLQTSLLVGFVALVVILIVLGLIIAFQRVRKGDEDAEEPQTYY